MYDFANDDTSDLEQLRVRLRRMTDDALRPVGPVHVLAGSQPGQAAAKSFPDSVG
jgi:hypothetical protein